MKNILLILLCSALLVGCQEKQRTTTKPNIILIFTDDQGYADLGAQGINKQVKTPYIDSLASYGIRFTSGYVTAPQCSPSRAGIVTGRYQQKFGFDDNDKGPLPADEITLAQRLKHLGYTTGMVGKWHMDPNHTSHAWLEKNHPKTLKDPSEPIPHQLKQPFTPEANGFEYFFWGTMNSYSANYDLDGDTFNKAKHISNKGFRVEVQTKAATQFIENNQFEPFFLYLSYFAPHVPLEAEQKYLDRFDDIEIKRRKYGLAMISAIDDGVGEILKTLRDLNLEEETLIYFISDNGAPLKINTPDTPITGIPGGDWDGSLNDPWIGEKGMLSEGGIRVPFIMYWKDSLPAGQVVKFPVSTLDVTPTSLAVAGSKPDSLNDGINILPYLFEDKKAPKRTLYWRFWNQAAVREGKWKYLKLSNEKEYLFNLSSKDHEKNNLIKENPKVATRLKRKLSIWSAELKEPGLPKGPINGQERAWYKYHLKEANKSASTTSPRTSQ